MFLEPEVELEQVEGFGQVFANGRGKLPKCGLGGVSLTFLGLLRQIIETSGEPRGEALVVEEMVCEGVEIMAVVGAVVSVGGENARVKEFLAQDGRVVGEALDVGAEDEAV